MRSVSDARLMTVAAYGLRHLCLVPAARVAEAGLPLSERVQFNPAAAEQSTECI